MKYLGKITDDKDLVTKEYVDNSVKITGVKGNSESSYRTGNVNLTSANIGAIQANSSGNTQQLARPASLRGTNDNTLDAKINALRGNRLAFLPADQIIIEKTTDGGTTWVDAGISDATKTGLFSETRPAIYIPLLNGVKSFNCGLRITITAMKYNVPSGTAETAKYNYWNENYIKSAERYNQIKEMYFWISANSDTISVKVERATGANSTTWLPAFNDSTFLMTGWSGSDYIRFSPGVFGGGTDQTTNTWNYRMTFMTKGTAASNGATLATTSTTSAQYIMEIRAYGDSWWKKGNEYAANDKIYTHDSAQNVTFPNKVTATGGFSGDLTGTASNASKVNNHNVDKDVPSNAVFTDTTYESKTAANGGTDVSLVTTGEKYTWNNKQDALISGTNIKTINNTSLLGSGDISTTYSTATTTADGLMSSADKTKLNGIGTVQTVNATAKTVANNTNVSLCNITLTAGTWVVTAGVRFPANPTGYRRMNLNQVNASAAADVQLPAVNGGSTQLSYTLVLQLTSSKTYHLNAWQNSGSSMNLVAGGSENGINFIRAVRIA